MTEGLFGSTSSPYFPFKSPGDHVEGEVIGIGQVQSRTFNPKGQGDLEFWPDGKPKMTAIITVATDMRDPSIEADDGSRSIWVKGKSMTDAVKAAVRAAGAAREGIVVGGHFSMTFTHETANDWGGNPTKHYEVVYKRPSDSESTTIVAGVTEQAPAPAQPAQANPLAGMDLDSLPAEAKAALQAMLAGQAKKG